MIAMTLIDADEVMDEILNDPYYDNDTINHFLGVIDDAPTVGTTSVVDAVPAVHCGKCKYYHPENGANYRCDRPAGRFPQIAEDPNGFCSFGERKDGEK